MNSPRTPVPTPPRAAHVMGETAGARVCSLAGGLAARGVEVTLCGPLADLTAYAPAAPGARLVYVETGTAPGPRADALALAALRSVCGDVDVVHAHGLRAGLLASLALSHARDRPALVVSWQAEPGARPPWARLVERLVARSASVVLAASPDLVDKVRALGARDVRLAPLAFTPPGYGRPPEDLNRMRGKLRDEFGAAERPLLFSAGPLEPGRGYGLLLEAARRWRDLRPRPVLAIAGEGHRRGVLQRRIDAERLPVRLLGCRDDLPEALGAADVVVLPGCCQARLLLAQQVLHAGVPLVAPAAGGMPELVGEAAVLVPERDAEALARAVTRLLADSGRRAWLASAGRAQAATWPTEDDTVAQVLSVYDELAAR